MRTLLVDDEPLALRRLQIALADVPGVEIVGTAADGDTAARMIVELRPEIVFLDVEMPGRSGMAVAAALPEDDRPEIVFVTAFEHYAPDAFEVDAADYLLKPVRLDRLRQALQRAARRRALKEAASRSAPAPAEPSETRAPEGALGEPCIWVSDRLGPVRVPFERIVWIEAAKDYVLIHTPTRAHIHRITMSELETRLDPATLPRVHRSAFVRLSAVRRVRQPAKGLITLVLDGEVEVQVGPSYVRSVAPRLRALGF